MTPGPERIDIETEPLKDRMEKSRVDEADILAAARQWRGLERLDQIHYAVLERSGGITVLPKALEPAALAERR